MPLFRYGVVGAQVVFCAALVSCRPVAAQGAAASQTSVPTNSPPSSVTLAGDVQWYAGSLHEPGTAALSISKDGSVQESWHLPHGARAFTRDTSSGACLETDAAGKSTAVGDARCLRPVAWFAPWTAPEAGSDGVSLQGAQVPAAASEPGTKQISFRMKTPDPPVTMKPAAAAAMRDLQTLSQVDITYDSNQLPVRLDFHDTPTSDPAFRIDTYVLFSDYRPEGGFLLPHHIQRYVQRTLQMDFTVTSVTVGQ